MIVVFTSAESISYYLASMCVTMLILYYIQKARLKAMIHVCIVKYLYQFMVSWKMLFITLINQNNVTTCYSFTCKIHEHVHNKQESVLYEIIKTVLTCNFCLIAATLVFIQIFILRKIFIFFRVMTIVIQAWKLFTKMK